MLRHVDQRLVEEATHRLRVRWSIETAGKAIDNPMVPSVLVENSALFGQGGLNSLGMAGMSTFFNRNENSGGQFPNGGQFGANRGSQNNFNRFNNTRNFERNRRDRERGGRQGRVQRRPIYRVGFETPAPQASVVQRRLQSRTRSPQVKGVRMVTSSSDQGVTVVLRGSVASEEDKRLAEQLVLLDPDVNKVTNELRITAPAPR